MDLLRQRVYGIVHGYEDLNDHERLCEDVLLQSVLDRHLPPRRARPAWLLGVDGTKIRANASQEGYQQCYNAQAPQSTGKAS